MRVLNLSSQFLLCITAWKDCRADNYMVRSWILLAEIPIRAPGDCHYILFLPEQPGIAQLATGEEIIHLSCTSSLPTMGVIVKVPLIPK